MGKLIYQWVSKIGMVNSVFTLYELTNGDDTEGEEFHGLEEWMLLRSLAGATGGGQGGDHDHGRQQGVKFF
ncbi:hypothetical protein CRUP_013851 [Coryphaenoides rupestris]|nr:hypothetical protein CRUP_013851 [Coryphaenoides rupestris]